MSYHFPDFRGSDWGRRLGTEDRPCLNHLSCVLGFVQDSQATHPPGSSSFSWSRRSLVPKRVESAPSPLPLLRGSPPHTPQPSPPPPPQFHSIDFCCMSTLITVSVRVFFFSFSMSLNDF